MKALKNIALGFGFSPTLGALLAETKQLADLFSANITLIHSGEHDANKDTILYEQLLRAYIDPEKCKTIYKTGDVPMVIAKVAGEQGADLLVSGALKHETFRKYYFGSVARNLARQAHISILLIPDPELNPKPIKKVIISINEECPQKVIEAGLFYAKSLNAEKIYFVKESSVKGSKYIFMRYYSEKEYESMHELMIEKDKEYINQLLVPYNLEGIEISINVLFGYSGISLVEFAKSIEADLLVDAYPEYKLGFWDKLFPHDIEYALLDLPCKLLLIN